MPTLVPNGEQTFLDVNGDPITAGKVYFYAPGTTNPQDTWVDAEGTATNTNPVVLDQAGRATIWGSGLYRQVVYDQFGNLLWDKEAGVILSALEASSLTVDGNAIIGGEVNAENLRSRGDSYIGNNLYVTGVSQAGNLRSLGDSYVGNSLFVTADVNANNVNASGQVTAQDGIQIQNPAAGGPSNIFGGLIVTAAPTALVGLQVQGDIQLNGDLADTGAIWLGGATNPGAGNINIPGAYLVNGGPALLADPIFGPFFQSLMDAPEGTPLTIVKRGGRLVIEEQG